VVRFDVAKSTIGNINTNKAVILKVCEENFSKERKGKLKKTDNEAVNSLPLDFFHKCRTVGITVASNCFKQKPRKLRTVFILKIFRRVMGALKIQDNERTIYISEFFLAKQNCSIDRCPEKVLSRKGQNVKLGNFPKED
jgi:hypothetical protein